ncbi:MAG: ABC transporter permease [Terriglobia bacterium]
MSDLIQDLRYGVRVLLKSPALTAVALLSLVLGISANTTIFSIVDAAFLRPWPVREPSQLAWVETSDDKGRPEELSYLECQDLNQQNQIFAGVAAFEKRGAILKIDDRGESLLIDVVSPNYFSLLGVNPVVGRTFFTDPAESRNEETSVVISYSLWQRHFAGDRGVAGKVISLSGKPMTVIGVAPPEFRGLQDFVGTDVWVSPPGWIQMTDSRPDFEGRGNRRFTAVARMQTGVKVAEIRTHLDTLARRFAMAYPESNKAVKFELTTENTRRQRFFLPAALVLAIVGLVLLISCSNVANLMIAKTEVRRREMAVRLALGAARRRIVRQLMTESLVFAVLGGALSLLVAFWLIQLVPSLLPPLPFPLVSEIRMDGRVLGYTALVSLLTAFIFGLVPALQASRCDLTPVLKGSDSPRPERRVFTMKNILVIAEIALSVVLMAGAGLLLRSLLYTLRISPGFDSKKQMLLLELAPPELYGYDRGQSAALLESLTARLRTVPGVKQVSFARRPQLSGSEGGEKKSVMIPGYPLVPGEEAIRIRYNIVALNYFQTMGTRTLQGRDFNTFDNDRGAKVVIINEPMARQFWPAESPVGKWINIGKADFQVVGVVEGGKYLGIHESDQPYLFFPFSQMFSSEAWLFVETAGDPEGMMSAVLRECRAVDGNVPIAQVLTLRQHVQYALYTDRIVALLLGVLGLLGIGLAMAGLYGIVSYLVNRRTREIGIRMALGAQPRDVVVLVLRQGLNLAFIGVGLGSVAALGVSRILSSILYGVKPTDFVAFFGAASSGIVISLLAALLPARRATRVDPMEALRYE